MAETLEGFGKEIGEKSKANDKRREGWWGEGRMGEGQHHQVCFGFLLQAFHDDQCAGRGSLLGATDPRDIIIKVRRGGKRGEKVGSAEQRVASVETDDDVTAGLLRPNRRPTAAVTNTRTCKHAQNTEALQIHKKELEVHQVTRGH